MKQPTIETSSSSTPTLLPSKKVNSNDIHYAKILKICFIERICSFFKPFEFHLLCVYSYHCMRTGTEISWLETWKRYASPASLKACRKEQKFKSSSKKAHFIMAERGASTHPHSALQPNQMITNSLKRTKCSRAVFHNDASVIEIWSENANSKELRRRTHTHKALSPTGTKKTVRFQFFERARLPLDHSEPSVGRESKPSSYYERVFPRVVFAFAEQHQRRLSMERRGVCVWVRA